MKRLIAIDKQKRNDYTTINIRPAPDRKLICSLYSEQ